MTDDPKRRTDTQDADFGALVGWTADELGDRIVLRMQSAQDVPVNNDNLRQFAYFLTKEQAVLLGNFLFRVAGETAPKSSRSGKLGRLFGKPG